LQIVVCYDADDCRRAARASSPPECASGNGRTARPLSARPRGFAALRHIH
jgi:hypothetical protein